MNRVIIIILSVAATGYMACDTKDNIAPLNDSFFVKLYAGVGAGDQFGNDIIATSDGGILIAGTSENETDNTKEILLIKTDDKGNELWTYGAAVDLAGISSISVGRSVIELPGSYLVGGTVTTGNLDRSIIMEIDYNGNFIKSNFVYTDTINNGIIYPVSNTLSKVTLGYSGILVSGETNHFAATATGINGFMSLFDVATLDTIPKSTGPNVYFGLLGDDIIAGAYEVLDTLSYKDSNFPTSTPTHFLAFGSALNPDGTQGYDFFYADFNSDYTPNVDVQSGLKPNQGNQTPAYVTRDGDQYWMIGETDETRTKIFMTGWLYSTNKWDPRNTGDIDGSTGVAGKGITVQTSGNYVIVGDETIQTDVHTEVHLSRVDGSLSIKPPWPKTYGAVTATYSASAVMTLQDGSIIIVGTADLQPVKKILVIKTGPNGEMSF
jgi:hypothetical protein